MILHMCKAPWQGQTTPWWQNFDVNRKALSLPICCKCQKISLKSDLMILYMYIAPRQGQTTPWGQNFDVNRKALSLCPFVANLNKKSLWSLILYIFFHAFIHVYSPGAGADKGSNFLYQHKPFVTLVICCKFLPLNDFLTFFLKKCIFSHIKA